MQNKRQDVVITIDVKEVLNGQDINGTKLPPRAECSASDFEDWVSSDEEGNSLCIMGQTHAFHRMKLLKNDDGCFLPKDYKFADSETAVRTPLLLHPAPAHQCEDCAFLVYALGRLV